MPAEKIKTVASSVKMCTIIISGAEAAANMPWLVIITMCVGAIANEIVDYHKLRALQKEYKERYER